MNLIFIIFLQVFILSTQQSQLRQVQIIDQLFGEDKTVSPLIVKANNKVGGQVPNGFGPKAPMNIPKGAYNDFRAPPLDSCPCAMTIQQTCPPCTSHPTPQQKKDAISMMACDCAPKLNCPTCPMLFSALHQLAANEANADGIVQQSMEEKAQHQVELYEEAQEYAAIMKEEEEKAIEASELMNEAQSLADEAKQHMLRAMAEARDLAESQLFSMGGSNMLSPPSYVNTNAMGNFAGDYLLSPPVTAGNYQQSRAPFDK